MTKTPNGYVEDWQRWVAAVNRAPFRINTQPPYYPDWAWRQDRWYHAYINLFTERWRAFLDRPIGDELSKRLGQLTGILTAPVALPLLWLFAL